jgi:hypothetical protein
MPIDLNVAELLKIHTIVVGDDWTEVVPGYEFKPVGHCFYLRQDRFSSTQLRQCTNRLLWRNFGTVDIWGRWSTPWQSRQIGKRTFEIRRDMATLSATETDAVFEYFRQLSPA